MPSINTLNDTDPAPAAENVDGGAGIWRNVLLVHGVVHADVEPLSETKNRDPVQCTV